MGNFPKEIQCKDIKLRFYSSILTFFSPDKQYHNYELCVTDVGYLKQKMAPNNSF